MKAINAATRFGFLAIAALNCTITAADDSGWYVGANAGQSRADIDEEKISRALLGAGFATNSITSDERDLGYKLFGGYQFSRYFALEGGYFDLGEFSYQANTTPSGTLRGDIELKGINFDAIGILPFTDRFSAFGRVGVNYAEAKDSFRGSGAVDVLDPHSSKRRANYKYGAGLQYALAESVTVRLEAERYRVDDAVGNKGDVDLFSVGLLYRFGQRQPAAAAPVAAREPAPAPPPVAAQPLPVAPVKVNFSADSLFDFNRHDVKPEGRQALDKFAAQLKGADFDVVTVTGHTDRIGSHEYNMQLSTRRAEAVKSYLVESAAIPAHKIVARGVNGAEPVTRPEDCQGIKARPQLIACLQPDRRVELEVSGTRK